ncbi:uncharacterized protein LOC110707405 [Chenopodium quinoa]|uniref:uncharacterized protein LOC110707405 n=1 Tax=Chenopodium quinoa TaxID=63459 RepID=UPI000B7990BF|nr:uncharacterized protein LOC110707405 [Chenopodium quinoa]
MVNLDYCIQCGFAVVVDRSSTKRFTASCLDLHYEWRIHSSRLVHGVTWAIKSIKNFEHTCRGLDERNPLVDVKWAAEKLMEDIRANNDISGKTLNELLWSRYGVKMATSTLYKTRRVALREINGGHDSSYGYLPKYCEMGAIDGLATRCRSLIGVDGAHLKGNFGGVLLSAVALDGNNELFPFAWAIVSREDGDSWRGIDVALTDQWPEVDRRYCCKHLVKNWKSSFPGPLMYSLFWLACSATSPFTFKKAMERIQKVNPDACVWLSNLGDQSRWTRQKFDPKICSDENKTNFVESLNATLGVDNACLY